MTEYPHAHHIYGGLYLGNLKAANDKKWLDDNGIDNILGMIDRQKKYKDKNYLFFPNLRDTIDENIMKTFRESFEFLDERLHLHKEKVLIHCYAGVSRSATVLIAYLMFRYGLNLMEAYLLVKERRDVAHPNPSFVNQLQIFERRLQQ